MKPWLTALGDFPTIPAIRRRVATNAVLIALIYGNVAALLLVCDVRLPRSPIGVGNRGALPNHWVSERLFRMFDLFDKWSWKNWGFAAYGSYERGPAPPEPTDDMVDVDLYGAFPQSLGEKHRRIFLLSYRKVPKRLKRGYGRMADTLLHRYNSAHPEKPVKQVFIYQYLWKKNKLGYYHEFADRDTALIGHN